MTPPVGPSQAFLYFQWEFIFVRHYVPFGEGYTGRSVRRRVGRGRWCVVCGPCVECGVLVFPLLPFYGYLRLFMFNNMFTI